MIAGALTLDQLIEHSLRGGKPKIMTVKFPCGVSQDVEVQSIAMNETFGMKLACVPANWAWSYQPIEDCNMLSGGVYLTESLYRLQNGYSSYTTQLPQVIETADPERKVIMQETFEEVLDEVAQDLANSTTNPTGEVVYVD